MIVAFSARYALEQLLDAFSTSLVAHAPTVMVPSHYTGSLPENRLIRIDCGTSKLGGVLASVDPRAHLQVIAAIRRVRPNVVHLLTGEGYPWALTLALTLRVMGIPLVITLHDPDPHPGNVVEWLNARLRRLTLRAASALQIFSEQHRARIREIDPKARVEVIPLGSVAGRFLAHRRPGVIRESLVLFFGRIEFYKGIDILCQAALLMPSNLRLAIAGPGELSATEQALVAQLGDRVEVHGGYLADDVVAGLMQRAAVLALPYRHVTQSLIPAIATAFGVPIVASALGHFVEEVPSLGGVLVPPENPPALADALEQVAGRGTTDQASAVTFDTLAPRFLALYQSLLPRASRAQVNGTGTDSAAMA